MNAELQKLCVIFDRYMDIEKSVVDVFCSTVNMDLGTQILDFCECISTKIMCVLIDTWTLRKVW